MRVNKKIIRLPDECELEFLMVKDYMEWEMECFHMWTSLRVGNIQAIFSSYKKENQMDCFDVGHALTSSHLPFRFYKCKQNSDLNSK